MEATFDERSLEAHDPPDDIYDLRLRLKRAVRWLREAEDIARVYKPAWPDRIRSIYEQVTEDVLEGRTSIPPMKEQLADAERRISLAYEASLREDPLDALNAVRAALTGEAPDA